MTTTDETLAVVSLYHNLHARWNARDAAGFAALFAPDGHAIGFDGSEHVSPERIASDLGAIFEHHATPEYVGKVREVRRLAAGVVHLRAVAGLVPRGGNDLNPALNAIQTILAQKVDDAWKIVVLQNTPAAYHGRPELAAQLTDELREVWRKGSSGSRPA